MKNRGVNAKSIAEVGDFDSHEYRKTKITGEDEKILSQFRFQDPKVVQSEMVEVLVALLGNGGEFTDTEFVAGEIHEEEASSACCTIS